MTYHIKPIPRSLMAAFVAAHHYAVRVQPHCLLSLGCLGLRYRILAEPGRPGFHSFFRVPRAAAADALFTGGSPLWVPPVCAMNCKLIGSVRLSLLKFVSFRYFRKPHLS